MAWRGFSGGQKPPNFQGIQFTVLSCREVSELVTRFYRRRDACFRKPRRIFIRQLKRNPISQVVTRVYRAPDAWARKLRSRL